MEHLTKLAWATGLRRRANKRSCFSQGAASMLQRVSVLLLLFCMLGTTATVSEVYAQDRYQECQRRARQVSGYDGPVPDEHLPGGAISGAVKGAATGAVLGAIFGGKKGAKKGAKHAAIAGGIIGAIKRAQAKSDVKERRESYQFEMEICMQGGQQEARSSDARQDETPVVNEAAEDDSPEEALSEEPFGLEALTCWNVISMPEDERPPLLLLIYGYAAAKHNDATHSSEKIANALSSFGQACKEPDRPAFEAVSETMAAGQVRAGEAFNLAETSCWEVMTLSGESQAFATLLLYGYGAGKAGQSLHSGARIEQTIARANTYCEAQVKTPMASVIETALRR